jgi:Domain of unknown function (DUF4383)
MGERDWLRPEVLRSLKPQMQMVTHVLMEVQMVKRVAMVFGVLFIAVGALGLASSGGMQMSPAMLLGLFPVNVLHNVVHIAIGVWGVLAARSFSSAVTYCKLAGFAYLCLAALGLVVPTFFGLIPLGGNDVFLHAVFGVFLVWPGFVSKEEAPAAAAAA